MSGYDNLLQIVNDGTPEPQRMAAMRGFARELDWTPSYELRGSYGVSAAENHLVVEHGLDNSAVISFLKAPVRPAELDASQRRNLLAISYNNLVEWHVFVSDTQVEYVNNLASSGNERAFTLNRSNFRERLDSSSFERITSDQNLLRVSQSCDDAFIQMISRWKRRLKGDYKTEIDNRNLSALFNSLIFVRGWEDLHAKEGEIRARRALLDVIELTDQNSIDIIEALHKALRATGFSESISQFVEIDRLEPFQSLDAGTARDLFRDFYRPSGSAYEFDFKLMSKHALSRIYERYISILEFREQDNDQLAFIPQVPTEHVPTTTGAVFTPQFVASFFLQISS